MQRQQKKRGGCTHEHTHTRTQTRTHTHTRTGKLQRDHQPIICDYHVTARRPHFQFSYPQTPRTRCGPQRPAGPPWACCGRFAWHPPHTHSSIVTTTQRNTTTQEKSNGATAQGVALRALAAPLLIIPTPSASSIAATVNILSASDERRGTEAGTGRR